MKANNIEELFGTLQQSVVVEWRKHLKTSKYSKHMALDEYYKEMPELIDALIESYMGHMGGKVEDYSNIIDASKLDALQYLEELHELVQSGYDLIPEDAPEVKSNLDSVKSLIDSVMYKVRELKECLRSLKDFLNESLMEARWTSSAGTFNMYTAESIKKGWKITIQQAYKLCDAWDDQFGGMVEWDDNERFVFHRDNGDTFKYDLHKEEWSEI